MNAILGKLAEPGHPLWVVLRNVSVAILLGLTLWANYNKVDIRDLMTGVEVTGGLALFDVLKKKIVQAIQHAILKSLSEPASEREAPEVGKIPASGVAGTKTPDEECSGS